MPSDLVSRANNILQSSNNLFPTYPIYWDSANSHWKKQANKNLIWRYYIISLFWKFSMIVTILAQFIILDLEISVILVQTFILLFGIIVSLIDLVVAMFTNEMVWILNMTSRAEANEWYVGAQKKYRKNVVASKNWKIAKKIYSDPSGYATLFGLIIFSVVILTVYLVVVVGGLDPLTRLIISCGYATFSSSVFETGLRLGVSFYAGSIVVMNIRMVVHQFMGIGITLFHMLNVIMSEKLSVFSIRFYRIIQTGIHFVWDFAVVSFGILLTLLFVMAVYVCDMAIVAHNSVTFIGFLASVVVFIIVHLKFHFCCHIYEDAVMIKMLWKNQLVYYNEDRKYMRRLVKSVSHLSIPAGNVGIYDFSIKMNYYNSIISYVTNVLVIFKDRFAM